MTMIKGVRLVRLPGLLFVAALILVGIGNTIPSSATPGQATPAVVDPESATPIKHVIIIMQENRSFDSYFGTYPGANGIPMINGTPKTCIPDPNRNTCVYPYHSTVDRELSDYPHWLTDTVTDTNSGRMDGFIKSEEAQCTYIYFINPVCNPNDSGQFGLMGYHDAREIPNYWAYAKHYVVQDAMFEPSGGYSLVSHLRLVSGWSARCNDHDVTSCVTNDNKPSAFFDSSQVAITQTIPIYPWTDMTYLLDHHQRYVDAQGTPVPTGTPGFCNSQGQYFNTQGTPVPTPPSGTCVAAPVSWGYYIADNTTPDCAPGATVCAPTNQIGTTEYWNPLPYFDTVQQDGHTGNILRHSDFLAQLSSNTLPAVSWVMPDTAHSEHAPYAVSDGQSYVTGLVNSIMQSPVWSSSAIFLAWDDWGGFYDHVSPPQAASGSYGIRTPGLLISPYAKPGYIDHQTLSFDAYNKFIEDNFLQGQRLDPTTDGRPDPRTSIPENNPALGNLASEFDFTQTPQPGVVLPVNPVTDLGVSVGSLTATPFTVTVGQTITVTGTSFTPGESVAFYWDHVMAPALGAITAMANGAVVATVAAPSASPGAFHSLIAYGMSSHHAATALLAVKAQLAVTPGFASPGTTVYVGGSGFGANETITIQTTAGSMLGVTTSDALGNVVPLTLTIAPTSPLGTFLIEGIGSLSKATAYYYVTVVPGATTTPQSSGTPTATGTLNPPTPTATPRATATNTPVSQPATTTPVASLVATPFTVTVGQTLTMVGTSFAPDEIVNFYWDHVVAPPLATTFATPDGAVAALVVAPASPAGAHTLIAYGVSSHRAATAFVSLKAQLTIMPSSARAGASITVGGSGFGANETITIQTAAGAVLGATTSDALGNVGPLTVTTNPMSPPGTYWIEAIGTASKATAYYKFTVVP